MGPRYWFRYLQVIFTIGSFIKGKKILEIGAGTLGMSSFFARNNKVTAIDLSPELSQNLNELSENIKDNIQCIEGDFLTLDFKEKRYDVIIAMEVLEHIRNDKSFLKRIKLLSKKNTLVVISVPAHMSLWSKHDIAVGHIRRYEKCDLIRIKKILGFSKYRIVSYGWPWINMLRYLRIISTPIVYKGKSDDFSQTELTINSGRRIKKFNFLSIFSNQFTIFPFWVFSLMFTRLNISDGYLIFLKNES